MTRSELLRLFCFGFEGPSLPDRIREHLGGGLRATILFSRNLRDLDQVCRLTAELAAAGARLIGVDQEGGRVVRLPRPFTVPPAAAAVGRTGDPSLARTLALAVGRELRAAGFTWNLVPVLDVHTNPSNPIIGDRAYAGDPREVGRFGLEVIRGFTEAGILTTAKHFPGHGDTSVDSHAALPSCPHPPARWRSVELLPFAEAIRAGVPSVMMAHLACPALDPARPSSLSPAVVTGVLRGELGFGGVVMIDDLDMGAIVRHRDVGEAAVEFLEAGGDLILLCRDAGHQARAVGAVERAAQSGRLTEDRLRASLDRLDALEGALAQWAAGAPRAPVSVVGSEASRALVERVVGRA
jgi:beta-N-acetylhexosaminidase